MWVSGFMPQEVQGKLYKIEKEARLEELSPDQVYAQRQSTAWLKLIKPMVLIPIGI